MDEEFEYNLEYDLNRKPAIEILNLNNVDINNAAMISLAELIWSMNAMERTNLESFISGINEEIPNRAGPELDVRILHVAGKEKMLLDHFGAVESIHHGFHLDGNNWLNYFGAPTGSWHFDLLIMQGTNLVNNLESFITPYFVPGHAFQVLTIESDMLPEFSMQILRNFYYEFLAVPYPNSPIERRTLAESAFHRSKAMLNPDTEEADQFRIHEFVGRGVASGASRFG